MILKMISDTLFECQCKIEKYLLDSPHVYEGNLKEKIQQLMNHMAAVQRELDTPPESESKAKEQS